MRLPDGTVAKSRKQYVAVWRQLGEDVARIVGLEWRCVAFDPGLTLRSPGSTAIEVDWRLALAIQRCKRVTMMAWEPET